MPLETADNKVKEICEILRKETLEPAQLKAKKIVSDAVFEADELIHKAKLEVARIREENKLELARELKVHESSIQLAIRQGISALRQGVEKIFATDLERQIEVVMGKEDSIAAAVSILFGLIEKEGLAVDLNVLLPKHVNLAEICTKLTVDFGERLKKSAIQIDDIKGGVEIKFKEKKISLELTDNAVKELLAAYVIPELQKSIFSEA